MKNFIIYMTGLIAALGIIIAPVIILTVFGVDLVIAGIINALWCVVVGPGTLKTCLECCEDIVRELEDKE